ncbi:MAG: DNA polymerase I [Clostridia bacterium]|nr:DNA polymerase I [Clostridia bacterium]
MHLLVLDGNSIINRAFYGIRLLSTKEGQPTNAVVGFLNILQKLRDMTQPDGVVAAFDVHAPTFRHELYSEYKAGRHATPPELLEQFEPVKQILAGLGCTVVECPGYEADDVLGTLAAACTAQGHRCTLATGDRDALQLVSDTVEVLLASTKAGQPETVRYDPAAVREKYRLDPPQLIQLKALMGDSSDHIPGVPGIGEKTATDLLLQSGTVEELYRRLDDFTMTPSVRAKLIQGEESARMSLTLGTICCTAPIDTDIGQYRQKPMQAAQLVRLLTRLELFKWMDKLGLSALLQAEPVRPAASAAVAVTPEPQPFAGAYAACRGSGSAYFLRTADQILLCDGSGHLFGGTGEEPEYFDILADPAVAKYTHDCKPVYKECICKGKQLVNLKMDTLLAAYLLDPLASGYLLPRLMLLYHVPCAEQAAALCAALPELCAALDRELTRQGQQELLQQIELPLAEVLAAMELDGIGADAAGIAAFGQSLLTSIDTLQSEIWEEVGYSFNLNSPKQLSKALFEDMGLPAGKKNKSGEYSTNADVLEKLKYCSPAVAKLLEYRSLTKLRSTYCEGLLKQIGADGRIHTTFNQTETRTGRISSTEPNLQNIPVRQPLGREMRRFFVARDGWTLCDADYSQIELRVLAHMAQDPAMTQAFRDGTDIHRVTASQVFGVPESLVSPLMRSRAKAVNFGIVYGIGAHSLAEDLGVSYREAAGYIEGYLKHYPAVDRFMQGLIRTAKDTGYACTLFGRRRPLPELSSSNAVQRQFGERVARNMPIQGTAADIIKLAMVRVYRRLREEKMQARLLLQIHDELIVEAPEEEALRAAALLAEEMERAATLSVRLETDVHVGRTWYDAKG